VISRWRKRPAHGVSGVPDSGGISAETLERARLRAAQETQD
jgi:hypothetical protein